MARNRGTVFVEVAMSLQEARDYAKANGLGCPKNYFQRDARDAGMQTLVTLPFENLHDVEFAKAKFRSLGFTDDQIVVKKENNKYVPYAEQKERKTRNRLMKRRMVKIRYDLALRNI